MVEEKSKTPSLSRQISRQISGMSRQVSVAMSEPLEEEVVEEEQVPPPCMDLTEYKLKVDHFDQVHALGQDCILEGAPNFRQVSGFPVYGLAQPTESGLLRVMDKVQEGRENSKEENSKVIWFNMRMEPVVYINGQSYAPRHPERMHEQLKIDENVGEMEILQTHFTDIVRERVENNPDKILQVAKDSCFKENPLERENEVVEVKVDTVRSLQELLQEVPMLEELRVPVLEENAPAEFCFDIMVEKLKGAPAATPCAFSCQAGRGRTSLGMIIACMVKEIQITTDLKKMGNMGLIPSTTVDQLIKQKFESALPKTQDDEDPLIKGEFEVIKELIAKMPEAKEAKEKVDRVIDICGPSPKGTGLQNLRECIIETKWKYDVAPEDKQVIWRQQILNFMERYFYLICFATYAKQDGPEGFQRSFVSWMEDHSWLRTMIQEGRDKLEWYRQVDPAKLNTLKELIRAPNYKDTLPTLIRTIYEFAFVTYSDLPRGPIKNNSMRKLASKTLMEILPSDILDTVQAKLDEQAMSPDFVTIVGLVSYYGQPAETVV